MKKQAHFYFVKVYSLYKSSQDENLFFLTQQCFFGSKFDSYLKSQDLTWSTRDQSRNRSGCQGGSLIATLGAFCTCGCCSSGFKGTQQLKVTLFLKHLRTCLHVFVCDYYYYLFVSKSYIVVFCNSVCNASYIL